MSKNTSIVVAVAIIASLIVAFIALNMKSEPQTDVTVESEASTENPFDNAQPIDGEESTETSETSSTDHPLMQFEGSSLDPLVIGSPDAPVSIIEYSSFSCPHCANFHIHVLPEIIETYVKTGKVRILFRELPLNKPAFEASIVERCMPADKRYEFMDLLFRTLNDWATQEDVEGTLAQYATLYGLSEERLAECRADEAMVAELLKGAKEASEVWGVTSTPTFIFNEGAQSLSGTVPFLQFSKEIEALLPEGMDTTSEEMETEASEEAAASEETSDESTPEMTEEDVSEEAEEEIQE